jgi:hypothetical protein
MKRALPAVFLFSLIAFSVPMAGAQDGSIEFVVKATPSQGAEEPVRGFPFYLLSKSFEDINREAEKDYPSPDMNAFIAALEVSPQLKAWMKKNQWVILSGDDFTKKVHVDDIMNVPEFYQSYTERESGDSTAHFPKPKFKPSDQAKRPEKYQAAMDEYHQAIRHYIQEFPETIDGIDIQLDQVNPQWKWNDLEGKARRARHARVVSLAQSKYLVARTETDLQGQGFFHQVPPGNYWLSTLDVSAIVGDAKSQWDLPLTVRPGQTAYIALSGANTEPSPYASQQ